MRRALMVGETRAEKDAAELITASQPIFSHYSIARHTLNCRVLRVHTFKFTPNLQILKIYTFISVFWRL